MISFLSSRVSLAVNSCGTAIAGFASRLLWLESAVDWKSVGWPCEPSDEAGGGLARGRRAACLAVRPSSGFVLGWRRRHGQHRAAVRYLLGLGLSSELHDVGHRWSWAAAQQRPAAAWAAFPAGDLGTGNLRSEEH